jgi:predicted RNA-binding protein with PIN domain
MPTYLDAHDLGNATEEQLKQAQNAPKDEFGVIHKNILYNKEENKAFCILDAPNKEAVEKTHQKLGIKCNWITEVKTTDEFVRQLLESSSKQYLP